MWRKINIHYVFDAYVVYLHLDNWIIFGCRNVWIDSHLVLNHEAIGCNDEGMVAKM